jgi:hypothetical protein
MLSSHIVPCWSRAARCTKRGITSKRTIISGIGSLANGIKDTVQSVAGNMHGAVTSYMPSQSRDSQTLSSSASTYDSIGSDSVPPTPWEFDYDVLVCGGGVVGTAFASKLLHSLPKHNNNHAFKIALLEQRPPPSLEYCLNPPAQTKNTHHSTIDVRTYALSPKSVRLLDSIGAWELLGSRKQPYNHMQIWDENSSGLLSFSANELGANELGYIAEDRTINAAIAHSMTAHAQYTSTVDMIYGSNIIGMTMPAVVNGSVGPVEVSIQQRDSKNSTNNVETKKIRARYGFHLFKSVELILLIISDVCM